MTRTPLENQIQSFLPIPTRVLLVALAMLLGTAALVNAL